ncbi:aminopeptidase N-like, partial [Lepeophtheirus salmonis]|uniref:aminopeptidase N-like n=1 Tax=Lepeophtheirus salmonis TaxID=72036 RepID=UPI001AE389DD
MDIINKVSGHNISITNLSKGEVQSDFVIIHLSTNLNKGSVYILSMKYTKIEKPDEDWYTDYYGESNAFHYNNGVYYTDMMPIYARTVFPCFDEPSFKSVFNITLRRPKNMISISNMPVKQTITPGSSEDFVYDIFESTPLMSTYLVAFVITNYKKETIPSNNTQLKIWTSEKDKSKTWLARSASSTLYGYLDQYFGKNLPITKQ